MPPGVESAAPALVTRHADLDSPWVRRARQEARRIGEARGWTPRTRLKVDQALVVLLSGYRDGEVLRYARRGDGAAAVDPGLRGEHEGWHRKAACSKRSPAPSFVWVKITTSALPR